MRHSGDIDLWIPQEKVDEAHKRMRELGFRDSHYDGLSAWQRKPFSECAPPCPI